MVFSAREARELEYEQDQINWLKAIAPNTDEFLDTVINGVKIRIPHKYLSNSPVEDGYDPYDGITLKFFDADLYGDYAEELKVETLSFSGVIAPINALHPVYGNTPCPIEKFGEKICNRSRFQMRIIQQHMQCTSNFPEYYKVYASPWQKRNCTFHEHFKKNNPDIEAVYDPENDAYAFAGNIHVGGDLEYPDYEFNCLGGRYPTCASLINIDGVFSFYYRIPIALIPEQRKIHENMMKKLRSFIVSKVVQ